MFVPPLLGEDELVRVIAVALAAVRKTPGGDRSLLVYDEARGLRPVLREQVFASPPGANEPVEAWWRRVFAGLAGPLDEHGPPQ